MGGQMFDAEARLNGFMLDPDKITIAGEDKLLADERSKIPLDEALVLNVMAQGVRKPVTVRKNEDGEPEVVDGRQRVRAAREANKRLKAAGAEPRLVPVIAAKGEDNQLFELMVSLNYHVPESPMHRARKLVQYIEMGHTKEQAKVIFCLPSVAAVAHLMALVDAPKKVQQMVDRGEMSMSTAVRAAKLKGPELDKLLAESVGSGKKVTVAKVAKAKKVADGGSDVDPPKRIEINALIATGKLPMDAVVALNWVLTGEQMGCVKAVLNGARMPKPEDIPAPKPEEKQPEVYGEVGMGTVGYDPGSVVG